MAVFYHYLAFVVFAAFTVFLHLPQLALGFHSPLNVKAEAVDGADFVIISWDYQAKANYSKIYLRSYFDLPHMKGHDTTVSGVTQPFCNGTKCSFCFSNSNKAPLSCNSFNSGYLLALRISLDFEMLVSYKVGACSTNESSSCLDSVWKNYTIPPGESNDSFTFTVLRSNASLRTAPSAVRNVQARPLSSTSVEVSWTAPNQTRGTIQSYTVYYNASDEQEHNNRIPVSSGNDVTKGKITGLQPNTKYTIWMISSTSAKNGERSTETSVTTYESECASSPCYHNSQCKLSGDSYECVCPDNWGGKKCNEPNGYTVETEKCLDFDGSSPAEANVTLATCVEKCNAESSCQSFDYGRGYNGDDSFQSDLYMKGVGFCKRWSEDKIADNELKSCSYDYYEKERSNGSAAPVVPFAILLSLSVATTVLM